jgi:hypothetical protein
VGALATEASSPVENLNEFKTKELKLSFLCVDSKREHETGEPVEWKNKITIKYRVYDKGDKKIVELISAPHVPIKYTTDGSNPKDHGGIYDSEVIIPKNTTYVLAVAETEGVCSDPLSIKIDWQKGSGLQIDKNKSLKLYKRSKTNDTAETYQELSMLKKHNAKLMDVIVTFFKTDENNNDKGWIELTVDAKTTVNIENLESSMENVRDNFMKDGGVNISLEYGAARFETGQYFLDWIAEKKKALKEFTRQEIVQ